MTTYELLQIIVGLVVGLLGVAVQVPGSLKAMADLRRKDEAGQDELEQRE
ncbi:hypothetical protein AB2L27_19735 [Kineococcus sp. LSe6-4]|uniref:Twin-arginine translocase TatA/TatE family subunit n=1 Tax=Kineococcus halophytocola TaxID=3234027 RepID=A0ABV4H5Y4_9ACTN